MAFSPIYAIKDRHGRSTLLPYKQGVDNDPTPGYQEAFDGGAATTTLYPYTVNGENAAFTAYTTNLDGGQATNPA
jgi:hypothetical protein